MSSPSCALLTPPLPGLDYPAAFSVTVTDRLGGWVGGFERMSSSPLPVMLFTLFIFSHLRIAVLLAPSLPFTLIESWLTFLLSDNSPSLLGNFSTHIDNPSDGTNCRLLSLTSCDLLFWSHSFTYRRSLDFVFAKNCSNLDLSALDVPHSQCHLISFSLTPTSLCLAPLPSLFVLFKLLICPHFLILSPHLAPITSACSLNSAPDC